MRYRFIVNPTAGRGDAARKWEQVKAAVEQAGLLYEAVFTRAPGDGVFIAKEGVEQGFEVLVAVGGDGTVNEVVRGIIESGEKERVKLGIIPCGTGNDLVRTLDIPTEIDAAVRILQLGHARPLDLGDINGDHFLNVVGIGFDAAVAYEINHNVKRLKGTAAYLYGVFKMLFQFRSPKMTIWIDGDKFEGRYFLVAVANGKYYGGGMKIAPNADPMDGLFDVVVVKDVSPVVVMRVLPSIFTGKHLSHPAVSVYRGSKVVLESDERVLVQADGELKGILPMKLELERNTFLVLAP